MTPIRGCFHSLTGISQIFLPISQLCSVLDFLLLKQMHVTVPFESPIRPRLATALRPFEAQLNMAILALIEPFPAPLFTIAASLLRGDQVLFELGHLSILASCCWSAGCALDFQMDSCDGCSPDCDCARAAEDGSLVPALAPLDSCLELAHGALLDLACRRRPTLRP